MTEKKTASLRHRGVCIEGADSLENILDFIDWLPKMGYNSFFLQFKLPYTFMARWYHHENNPLLPEEEFDTERAEAYTAVSYTHLTLFCLWSGKLECGRECEEHPRYYSVKTE